MHKVLPQLKENNEKGSVESTRHESDWLHSFTYVGVFCLIRFGHDRINWDRKRHVVLGCGVCTLD
jgi:hypothetical protein